MGDCIKCGMKDGAEITHSCDLQKTMGKDMQLVFEYVKKTIKKCRPFPEALLGSLYGVGVVIDPELQGNDWYICCSQEMVDELKKESNEQ